VRLSKLIEFVKNEPVTGLMAYGMPSEAIKKEFVLDLDKYLSMVGFDINVPEQSDGEDDYFDVVEDAVSQDVDDDVLSHLCKRSLAMAYRYSNPVGLDVDRGAWANKSTGKRA